MCKAHNPRGTAAQCGATSAAPPPHSSPSRAVSDPGAWVLSPGHLVLWSETLSSCPWGDRTTRVPSRQNTAGSQPALVTPARQDSTARLQEFWLRDKNVLENGAPARGLGGNRPRRNHALTCPLLLHVLVCPGRGASPIVKGFRNLAGQTSVEQTPTH